MLTLRELLLVLPGAPHYLPPPRDPDLLREGRRLAERDVALGHTPGDWSPDEREHWHTDYARFRDLLHVYWGVRRPERMTAPAVWPEGLIGIVAGTLIAAHVERLSETRAHTWRIAPDLAVEAFERSARRRAARVRGLTPETAPRTRATGAAMMIVLALGLLAARRLGPTSWEFWLAGRIVRELDERRSWRRAFR